jgi:glycosyltransferase involved in cell wall biosynthesis/SAM-dependent methyltransferase
MPKYRESLLAHRLLDGLEGIEIGGAAHNPFGLKTRNVDFTDQLDTIFKKAEIVGCGEAMPVDIVAPGDDLPLEDSSVDFVISSHVMEHFAEPIKALKEWHRVVRPGGYIFVIAPHKNRTFDRNRERTTLAELIDRHETGNVPDNPDAGHCSVWITEDFVELINYLGWPIVAVQDFDDKVGNGFTVVIQVEKDSVPPEAHRSTTQRIPVSAAGRKRRMSLTFLMGPTANIRTGSSASMLEYVRRFQDRGHNVSITTWPEFFWNGSEAFPNLGFNVPIHFNRSARRESLSFEVLNKSPRDFSGELQFLFSYLNLLTPAIPDADLVIATNWDTVIPAWLCGKGKPVHFAQQYDEVAFTLDGNPAAGLQGNPLLKLLCRSVFQMPVSRIANSSWLSAELRRRFQETVPVSKPGVDTQRFHPRAKKSAEDGVQRVVTYSRPEKWRGFQDAVAAMQPIFDRYRGKVEWHVYGFPHAELGPDNPHAPYTFHGQLGHGDLSRLYAESDIVLFPQWCASFPLPPIEAMACGTAVITTPGGTEDYVIDGHTAILVRPRVVSDFVVALDGLIRMPEFRERLARNGRAMAESLTWEDAIKSREELLWRIYHNEMPNTPLQGLDSGIVDGYGVPVERLTPEIKFENGELLHGSDENYYLVESGRLRRVADPSAVGLDPQHARPLDSLTLLRNALGPEVTSPANYFSSSALRQPV